MPSKTLHDLAASAGHTPAEPQLSHDGRAPQCTDRERGGAATGFAALLSPESQRRWLIGLLLLGLTARIVRYLLCFPLWEDEAMLSANFLGGSYADLLKPLNYCQVAPPLFLWCQATVVRLVGFNEYALRLVPFLCGLASLVLFWSVARRAVTGTALVVAVGIFAVAYPNLRYAAEAKPYGCDLFLALATVWLLTRWYENPQQQRWLWLLAALVAPAVGFSFPMLFVGGAVSVVVGWTLLRERRFSAVAPWIVYNVALLAGFFALAGVTRAIGGDDVQARMAAEHWGQTFPPLANPLKLATWLALTHTGALLAYPVGDDRGGSILTFLCVAAGVVALWRTRQWRWLGLCLLPLGLNFAAAALHKFPYGGHVRMGLYHGWAFCLLAGMGAAALLEGRRHGRRILTGLLIACALLGGASLARDIAQPYKSTTTLRAREFAHWFWPATEYDAETVCLESDLHANLSPGTYNWGWSALYLCNQRIYSPRHARGELPALDRVSPQRPLRCVLYRSATEERDASRVDSWLHAMAPRYELVAHDRYPFLIEDKLGRKVRGADVIEVFKFAPRAGAAETASRLPLPVVK